MDYLKLVRIKFSHHCLFCIFNRSLSTDFRDPFLTFRRIYTENHLIFEISVRSSACMDPAVSKNSLLAVYIEIREDLQW